MRVTDTLTQITHTIQKTNKVTSWREVSDKKKNRNNLEMTTTRKQLKMSRYQSSKSVSMTNFFEGLRGRTRQHNH